MHKYKDTSENAYKGILNKMGKSDLVASKDVANEIKNIRGSCQEFVDWRQCAAVMQKEAVTVTPKVT
jgi:hypothetical protein